MPSSAPRPSLARSRKRWDPPDFYVARFLVSRKVVMQPCVRFLVPFHFPLGMLRDERSTPLLQDMNRARATSACAELLVWRLSREPFCRCADCRESFGCEEEQGDSFAKFHFSPPPALHPDLAVDTGSGSHTTGQPSALGARLRSFLACSSDVVRPKRD